MPIRRAGTLRTPLRLQPPEIAIGADGAEVITWPTEYPAWGLVEALTGREYMGAAGFVDGVDTKITVRFGFAQPPAPVKRNAIPGLNPAAYYKFRVGITEAGTGVSQWDDQSGNSRHLLQLNDAQRPTLNPDGSIRFEGNNDELHTAAFVPPMPSPFTVYMLVRQYGWLNSARLWGGGGGSEARVTQSPSSPNVSLSAGGGATGDLIGLPLGEWHVFTSWSDGLGSGYCRVDSTPGLPQIIGAGGINFFELGAFADIEVMEAAVFPVAHNDATQAQVVSYLQSLLIPAPTTPPQPTARWRVVDPTMQRIYGVLSAMYEQDNSTVVLLCRTQTGAGDGR